MSYQKDEVIAVSACLLGVNCKYNGKNNLNIELLNFLEDKKVIRICPETMGGLKSPRDPSEIRNGRVYSKSGVDLTEKFIKGANASLKLLQENNCHIAILKANSPSCGYLHIYDGTFSSKIIEGSGVCAKLFIDQIPGMKIFNECNYSIVDWTLDNKGDNLV